MNRLIDDANLKNIDKKIIVLLFTHVDDFRYMKIKKQNVFALIRIFDKFIFFIIFICNSNWKKIKRDLFVDVFAINRSNFVARVFQLKLKKFMKNFTKNHVLNETKTHIYVIEFQKRNLFHVHILIIANFENDVNSKNVDKIVKTIIFDSKKNRKFYDLIFKHMIHKNCLKNANVVCHDEKNNCIKYFFKSLCEKIDLNDFSNYSKLTRFVMSFIENTSWNNTWMMLYNSWILKKYQTYINVEICIFVKSVFYLYKYIYKKNDFVNVFITIIIVSIFDLIFKIRRNEVNMSSIHRNDKKFSINEISIFHDVRWIKSCEIAWRILNLFIEKIKFVVIRLVVHLKNQQRVSFNSNKSISQLQKSEKLRHTTLTKYFDLNRIAKKIEKTNQNLKIDYKNVDKNFKNYLYQNFFTHFVWSKKKKIWTIRKKNTCVDKMYFINFKFEEVFYLRLLLSNRKNVIFFENFRTVDVQIENATTKITKRRFMINKKTCVILKFIVFDDEWHEIMKKIIEFETTAMLRNLLLIIFLKCASAESLKLWKQHKIA